MRSKHQRLPSSGPEREALRHKGKFWTPHWVASAMVRYVRPNISGHLFDPASGACAFFQACKKDFGDEVHFVGCDVDLTSLEEAKAAGLTERDVEGVIQRDFVLDPPERKFASIVANPPYIRHHRLSVQTKQQLRLISRKLIGKDLDGRAGLHVYFLLRALELLEEGGRLAFIIPGDTFEGVFAHTLWDWLLRFYTVDAVMTFSGDATPFPGVDTNAVVVCIRNSGATSQFQWARCTVPESDELAHWVDRGFHGPFPGEVFVREASEGLRTGLSRPPAEEHAGPRLADFASVMRGIATGDNDFFFLTSARIAELGLDPGYFVRAIGRTRDAIGDRLALEDMDALDSAQRPTYLLSLAEEPLESLSVSLQNYLREGEKRGMSRRALISTRQPWYRMERRTPPPLLFAYLGRRNSRFILNRARVVPLTAFLCIYPKAGVELESFWKALNDPRTLPNLRAVAKSYGSDALKVEPRALERLPIPAAVASEHMLMVTEEPSLQKTMAFSS